MRGRKGSTDMIDKARNIVTALREMTNDAAKKDALVAMYYQLAVELLAQFDGLEQADEKAAFATSLATFMRSIQEQSSDGRTLMWVGSTLNSVAEKLGAAELEKNARDYYEQARLALDAAAQAGFGSDPEANLRLAELKRQTALAQRGLGNYDEALELLVEVLKTKPSHLPAQVDAAMTLQQLGERKNDADAFVKAVGGTRKETLPNSNRPTNVVWGWMLIAKATQAKEAFRDDYFNAVYNMAYCRLRWGELTKRNDAVNSALVEIQNQFKQFPELGGPRWKPKFNELAKQIQTRLGKSADGLQ
jgi:tetratricopeptide (TPR) repeat protein